MLEMVAWVRLSLLLHDDQPDARSFLNDLMLISIRGFVSVTAVAVFLFEDQLLRNFWEC